MRGWSAALAVALVCLVIAGCASIGEPLPPSLGIPARANDLTVVQRGDELSVSLTVPAKTTEGIVLKATTLEVHIGPGPTDPRSTDPWSGRGKTIAVDKFELGKPVQVSLPSAQYAGQEVTLGVRLVSRRGRAADWSNFITLPVLPAIQPPANVRAAADPRGVKLTWLAAGQDASYRVYRQTEKEKEPVLLGPANGDSYVDESAQYGTAYSYRLQTMRKAGKTEAESQLSPVVTVTPLDTFAPAVPIGINAIAGLNTVELTWERNTESDFREYRIFRAADTGAPKQVAEKVTTPAFSDRAVESGKKYRYTIVAVDALGNTSNPSEPVEIAAP